ncbi:sodium-dependent multivitamin transporter-like [Haliotis cracherodii]|uniref:sodium-dependent multivitamin transporter-like n=1 Tax=Haliotis cracherodii TaxID=6455 RepID=UPI0039EA6808
MAADYSIVTGYIKTFSVVDYVVFAVTLILSAAIGVYVAIRDRNNVSTGEFLFGGRKMHVIPVAMSLLVTFLSALTLLGTPAEVYNYNTMFWWICLGYLVSVAGATWIFIPFFYKLGLTSIFEYLEMRFGRAMRLAGSLTFILQTMIYMSFVLYAPSLALNAVTGFDLWGSVAAVGLVSTMYTALGGMKAVLWTDTFQAGIMFLGLIAVLIRGSSVVGGFGNAWSIAHERSRVVFDDFDPDPSTRHSWWALVVGGGFLWMSLYGANQAQVQRAVSCPSVKKAQLAMLVNIPGLFFLISICCMVGVVMFAFYSDCHPIGFNNLISRTDQLVPLYVMDILADTPGVPGIFVSSLFSGSLSSLSSNLNAMAAVIPQDIVRPYFLPHLTDRKATIMSKVIVLLSGAVMIVLAFMVSQMGTVLQASYSVYAIINGPIFGVFVLGMIFPWANNIGAIVGFCVSTLFMFWVGIGAFVTKATTSVKSPVLTQGCNWNVTNTTTTAADLSTMPSSNVTHSLAQSSESSDPFYRMYTLSYLYYTPTAMAILVIVGLIVSFITGPREPSSIDPRLICPLFDCLFPCLPEKILKPLRFGVSHKGKYDLSMPKSEGPLEDPPGRHRPDVFSVPGDECTDNNLRFQDDQHSLQSDTAV